MELVKQDVDYLSQEAVNELANDSADICITIFMPTHRRGSEIEQDPIRLKNLLGKIEHAVSEANLAQSAANELLDPLRELLVDRTFWQHQSTGLALFRTPERLRIFRLPLQFEELTIVNRRPYIKPLLPLVVNNGYFYLLTLSQNEVRLFEGTKQQLGELTLGETPTSLDEAMRFDEFDDQLQFHTGTGTHTGGGRRAAIFHGHSNAGDEAVIKENIKRFLNQVDKGVYDVIDDNRTPLVLAGVKMMCGLYNEVSSYPTILAEHIGGNVETVEESELHAQAWTLVEPHFGRVQQEAIDIYWHLAGNHDSRAVADLRAIVADAYYQRIDTLFIAIDSQQWGSFEPESSEVDLHETQQPGDEELLDFAVVHTLINGGTVYALQQEQIPEGAPAAAIRRYG